VNSCRALADGCLKGLLRTAKGFLRLEKHPDKTFIGRVGRGFDFLGYRLEPGKLTVAEGAVHNFVTCIDRLYEQGAGSNGVDRYVKRWMQWAKSGIGRWGKETGGVRKGQAPDMHMPLQVIAAGMFCAVATAWCDASTARPRSTLPVRRRQEGVMRAQARPTLRCL
jgi:hypothetical protein